MPVSSELLLVDDDPAHARLFERTLRRAGIRNRIVHVDRGTKALELLCSAARETDSAPPDPLLVVLDLNMPGMDGFELLVHLKSDARTRHLPVFVLTTTDDQKDAARCRELGCDAFLYKPVDPLRFMDATRRIGLVLQRTKRVTTGEGGT